MDIDFSCQHTIDVKVDGNYVISYCIKCGDILVIKPITNIEISSDVIESTGYKYPEKENI